MTEQDCTKTENKRARVRRLVIDPLAAGGMRGKHGTAPDGHRAFLDRVCDELARLSDRQLVMMRGWMEANGEGSAKCFWPAFVSIAGVAQGLCPRPIEELPELSSWFGSRAGPEAAGVPGRLVMELRFIEKKRRPPVMVGEAAMVARRAAELHSDVLRARELRDCGRMYDEALLGRYDRDRARAEALVAKGEAGRAAGDAA
ncbi:hypothetical protein [uncultured Pseudosulfitobacter sp.]|uniref:hypothetical protein n=1 Tax=uncultured Pseudosulfitobacter sp. TaxID=2854214 RepID=UPI0030D99DBC|tara:strand:+ start:963 stop:1565 length:603 start_codon:yes stop_codon:yes gene_type:complete